MISFIIKRVKNVRILYIYHKKSLSSYSNFTPLNKMKRIILAILLSLTLSSCSVEPIPIYPIPIYPVYDNIGFLYPNYTQRYYGCGLITSKINNGNTRYSFDINQNGTFITVYIDPQTFHRYYVGNYICFN